MGHMHKSAASDIADCGQTMTAPVALLNAHILRSATVSDALQTWCEAYAIGWGGLRSEVLRMELIEPLSVADGLLFGEVQLDPTGLMYRRVNLRRGNAHLATAEIWYADACLPADMRARLASTDAPFGRVVAEFEPERRNFAVIAHVADTLPDHNSQAARPVLEHRARLMSGDGVMLAVTRELFLESLLVAEDCVV